MDKYQEFLNISQVEATEYLGYLEETDDKHSSHLALMAFHRGYLTGLRIAMNYYRAVVLNEAPETVVAELS